jgi:indolepyruvate ferredoxin oxidoreductase beta subunit
MRASLPDWGDIIDGGETCMSETKSAILVGVGGQGTILTAKVLIDGLLREGYDIKMSEVHGMSQRGGSVSTQVHWGKKVFSPVIGEGAADVLVSFEKMEAIRFSSYLKTDGVVIINDYAITPSIVSSGLAQYPDECIEAMQKRFQCYPIDAAGIAKDLGNIQCMNIVLFGSLVKVLNMEEIEWEKAIASVVPERHLGINIAAYFAGRSAVKI